MSKDTIYRQDAIDAICNACGNIDCDKMDKCEKLQLPPANCSEFPNNSDTISRQAAIDTIEDFPHGDVWNVESMEEMVDRIKQLPSAQPEIIQCKDCKYNATSKKCLNPNSFFLVPADDDFCSYAEKREVAT